MRDFFKGPVIFLLKPMTALNTLFLDRDGVLNHAVIRGSEISSPRSMKEFQLTDDIDALNDIDIQKNWNLVVISNQPDLSRGRITLQLLQKFHSLIASRIMLNAVYLCPHLRKDDCGCRKPACGLIQHFRENYSLIGKELLIGDQMNDQGCAKAANIPFFLRCRPYNQELKASSFAINHLNEINPLLKKEIL